MTVALSRARLGLYILGRRTIFESCHELREAFEVLLRNRPDKLMLVTKELWPSNRILASEGVSDMVEGEVAMEGVSHLGLYVNNMTREKLEELKRRVGEPAVEIEEMAVDADVVEEPVGDEEGGQGGGQGGEQEGEQEGEEDDKEDEAEEAEEGGRLSAIEEEEKDE
jgi:intron-binding protein aquarius